MDMATFSVGQVLFLLMIGLVGGVVSATLGVGSGIILVPALVLMIGLPQKSAQGTVLAVMVPMALMGASRYIANPDIEVNMLRVVLLALGAVVGAFLGAAVASRLPGHVLRRIFACFLLVVAARMLWQEGRKTGCEARVVPAPDLAQSEEPAGK